MNHTSHISQRDGTCTFFSCLFSSYLRRLSFAIAIAISTPFSACISSNVKSQNKRSNDGKINDNELLIWYHIRFRMKKKIKKIFRTSKWWNWEIKSEKEQASDYYHDIMIVTKNPIVLCILHSYRTFFGFVSVFFCSRCSLHLQCSFHKNEAHKTREWPKKGKKSWTKKEKYWKKKTHFYLANIENLFPLLPKYTYI